MTTLTLYESIQRIVQDELRRVRTAELAVVQEQHPHAGQSDTDNYACTVVLRDAGMVLRKVPVATSRIGAVSIPAVGELVLVQFVGGDVNAPVIVGRLYNEEDRPPPNEDGVAILHVPLGAGDDEAVHVELRSGDERTLSLAFGSGLSVTLADDDPVVAIDAGGKASVTIGRDGTVAIENSGKLELKATEIAVEAQGQLTLKGAVVKIN
jgi:phage baseplate assembly protein gpV